MTRLTLRLGTIRRSARGPALVALVALVAVTATALAGLTLADGAHAASEANAVAQTVDIAPANGGVSDDQLAVAIVLPLIFGGCLVGVMLWAVSNRAKRDEEETQPMPWWRTGAWYGRREDEKS